MRSKKRERGGCCHGPIGLTAQRVAASLRYSAGPMDVDVYLERGIWPGAATGRPRSFAEQSDGPPCTNPDCPYRYQVGTPHRTEASALDAAASHAVSGTTVARTFAKLSLHDALAVDATELEQLDDRRLAANDPDAQELLRALAEEGYDVAWIRSARGGHLMLVFIRSFGGDVEIVSQRSRLYDGEQWLDDGLDPDRAGKSLMAADPPQTTGLEPRSTRYKDLIAALISQNWSDQLCP